MPDFLLQLDRHCFYLINHNFSNPVFDAIMPLLRNLRFWIPLYIFIIAFVIWNYKNTGVRLIFTLLLTVGVADYGSASVIKTWVQRSRPCRDEVIATTIISRVPCGTGYSFPSTHASDHFAMSIFLALVFYRKWRWVWFWTILWAMLVSFAQVYVGVHYPVDVTAGALFGTLIGTLFAWLFKKYHSQFA
ncbi:phosphatase PAP2 family protein [Mucilaginibacter robiniae]|uniref:Phosphatase PAP2 family protein n=1 Tax=Mucilaginibacter robiniae TaxID=2728022 RepID=A0A7L5E0N5_9SPHI|nr:phosphatase PAP2 family protein [Mucilaginibacter robiniae]QJD94383.1 phosphatase PAP2 family protein [Mucilaginibacter robiniae]